MLGDDRYIRARLEEELHARRRALALHSLPFQQTGEQGAESDVRDGLLWALDSHEGHFAPDEESSDIFDPDLRRLDIRLRQSTSRSDDMRVSSALFGVPGLNRLRVRTGSKRMRCWRRSSATTRATIGNSRPKWLG